MAAMEVAKARTGEVRRIYIVSITAVVGRREGRHFMCFFLTRIVYCLQEDSGEGSRRGFERFGTHCT